MSLTSQIKEHCYYLKKMKRQNADKININLERN